MRDSWGGGRAYAVVTEELVLAVDAVRQMTSSAQEGVVEALPQMMLWTGHGDVDTEDRTRQGFEGRGS